MSTTEILAQLPALTAANREKFPSQLDAIDSAVVSVKFCKSGSVVRGFGEIKRFMGRV
jgi:hypothetical protein